MRVFRWIVIATLVMTSVPACTRNEEKPVASATAAASPAPAAPAATGAEAQDGDEILMVWAEAERGKLEAAARSLGRFRRGARTLARRPVDVDAVILAFVVLLVIVIGVQVVGPAPDPVRIGRQKLGGAGVGIDDMQAVVQRDHQSAIVG